MIDSHNFVACPCESYGKGDEQSEEIDKMESSITRTERVWERNSHVVVHS